jgi:hypothetical protein
VTVARAVPPWRWMSPEALVEDVGSRRVVIAAARHGSLVTCGEDGRLVPLTPDHPRARLLAAAPKLLAELRNLADILEASNLPFGGSLHTARALLTELDR